MYFKQCFLVVLLALCMAGFGDAIRCYECQSTIDPEHCGENFSESKSIAQIDCNIKPRPQGFEYASIPTRCSKSVIEDAQRGVPVTIRGCHYQNPNTATDCTIMPGRHTMRTCVSCSSDLCNGASKNYIALGTTLLVLTSAMLML